VDVAFDRRHVVGRHCEKIMKFDVVLNKRHSRELRAGDRRMQGPGLKPVYRSEPQPRRRASIGPTAG
jgi:hypothetical protein